MQKENLTEALGDYQLRLEAWERARTIIEGVSRRLADYHAIPYCVSIMPGIAPNLPLSGHLNFHVRDEDMDDFVAALRQRTGIDFKKRNTARGGYAAISDNVEFNVDAGPIASWRKRKASEQ